MKKKNQIEKKVKLKHWWWAIFPPVEMERDQIILNLSISHPANKKVTEKLLKNYLKKYYYYPQKLN